MADYSALHSAMKKYTLQIDTKTAEGNLASLGRKLEALKGQFEKVTGAAKETQQAVEGVKAGRGGMGGGGTGGGTRGAGPAGTTASRAGGNTGKGGNATNDQFRGRVGAGAFGGGLFSFAGLGVGGGAAVGIAGVTLALQAGIQTIQLTMDRLQSATTQLTSGFQAIASYGTSAAQALAAVAKSALEYQSTMETAVQMWTMPMANSMGLGVGGGQLAAQGLLGRVRQYSLMTPMTTQELVPGIGPLARTDRWARGGPEAIMNQLKILGDLYAAQGGRVPIGRIAMMMQRIATKNTVGRELLEFSKWGITQPLLREKGVTWNNQNQVELEKMGGGDKEAGRTLLINAINQVIRERYGGSMFLQSATMQGIASTVMENIEVGMAQLVEPFTGPPGERGEAHNDLAAIVDKLQELTSSDGWKALSEGLSAILHVSGSLVVALIAKFKGMLGSEGGKNAIQQIVAFFSQLAGTIMNIAGSLSNGNFLFNMVTILRDLFNTFAEMAPILARSAIAGLAFKNAIEDLKDAFVTGIVWILRHSPAAAAQAIGKRLGINTEGMRLWDRMTEGFSPEFAARRHEMREKQIQGLEKLLPLVDAFGRNVSNQAAGERLRGWKPWPVEQTQYWRDLQAQSSREMGTEAGAIVDEAVDSVDEFGSALDEATATTETLTEAWNRLTESFNKSKNKSWMPIAMEPMAGEAAFWDWANQMERQSMGKLGWDPDTPRRIQSYRDRWNAQPWYRVYGTGLPEGTMFPIHQSKSGNELTIPYGSVAGQPAQLVITLETTPDAEYLIGRAKMKYVAHPALAGSY